MKFLWYDIALDSWEGEGSFIQVVCWDAKKAVKLSQKAGKLRRLKRMSCGG